LNQPDLFPGCMTLVQPPAKLLACGHIKCFADFHTITSVIARSGNLLCDPYCGIARDAVLVRAKQLQQKRLPQ